MKRIERLLLMEPRTIALLLGLAVGLGLAVNEMFFAAVLVLILIVTGHWTMQKGREHLRDIGLRLRHP